ncbi:MAG: hypothetical protein U9Q81_02525 [Pseudomonadota bacterium]|nr:hypothetical protein [Pseudomonadota bacterium]
MTAHFVSGIPTSFLLLFGASLLCGCATEEGVVQEHFGESVRHMIAMQTTDPGHGAAGLEGEKAEAVMRAYREDVAKPKEVEKDLVMITLGK